MYTGGVAVCEPTSFGEPIMIYRKGAVINLHAVMFDVNTMFRYVAVSEGSFNFSEQNKIEIAARDLLNQNSFLIKPPDQKMNTENSKIKDSQLYSIEKNTFLELCSLFPETAQCL